jgi:hypothetical protein
MGVTIPRGSRALSQAQYAHINEFLGVSVENGVLSADPRFTSYCMNMTSPTTGGLERRWGTFSVGTMPGSAQAAYYSQATTLGYVQIGTGIYKTSTFSVYTLIATMSTSATGYFVDFVGKVIYVHPVDGTFSYDGAAWTLISAAATGTCAAVFQNKLWVAGVGLRVKFSDAGATTNIGVGTNFNDIREVNDAPVVALGTGTGLDFSNESGLLVFKNQATYRITNSTTGAYVTLSAESGAAGPRSVTAVGNKVVIFAQTGIYVTDGLTSPVKVSQQIQRWFTSYEMDQSLATLAKVCAGTKNGRAYFAFRRINSSYNSSILEYDPDRNAFYPHVLATATTTPATPDPTKEGYGGIGIGDFIQLPTSYGIGQHLAGAMDASGVKVLDLFLPGIYTDDGAVNGTNYSVGVYVAAGRRARPEPLQGEPSAGVGRVGRGREHLDRVDGLRRVGGDTEQRVLGGAHRLLRVRLEPVLEYV